MNPDNQCELAGQILRDPWRRVKPGGARRFQLRFWLLVGHQEQPVLCAVTTESYSELSEWENMLGAGMMVRVVAQAVPCGLTEPREEAPGVIFLAEPAGIGGHLAPNEAAATHAAPTHRPRATGKMAAAGDHSLEEGP